MVIFFFAPVREVHTVTNAFLYTSNILFRIKIKSSLWISCLIFVSPNEKFLQNWVKLNYKQPTEYNIFLKWYEKLYKATNNSLQYSIFLQYSSVLNNAKNISDNSFLLVHGTGDGTYKVLSSRLYCASGIPLFPSGTGLRENYKGCYLNQN